jgi:hypothetical protein
MHPTPTLDDIDVAFGSISFLPAMADLPPEYRDGWYRGYAGCKAADALFFDGGSLSALGYEPRDGVDPQAALRALGAALGSFQPKHEHKIAAVGWLIDQWFVKIED